MKTKLVLLFLCVMSLFAQKTSAQSVSPCGVQTQHGMCLFWTDTLNPAGTTYDIYRLTGACPTTTLTTTTGVVHLNSTAIVNKFYFDSTTVAGQTYCWFGTAGTGANVSGVSNDVSGASLSGSFPQTMLQGLAN